MNTMFWEFGAFCIALVLGIYLQIYSYRKTMRDCLLFGRLLLATAAILLVDTIGWVIDGNPIGGQVWFTTVIDGLDLFITTVVCWCWVQYALYIAAKPGQPPRRWYREPATPLLLLQGLLVCSSQLFGFYYSVDAQGAYHRGQGYFIHVLISLTMLCYSSAVCLLAYRREADAGRRRELIFVATTILVPIGGNVFQMFVYGYPTVWLCMVFMLFIVYIHILNKRINAEREAKNRALGAALAQAQAANAAKTDFLARMSHDMRTPMNGILGLTCLMEEQTDIELIKKDLPQLRESGEYLLQLINDVLDVNKVESGKIELHPKPCDEKAVFGSIIAMVKPRMEQKNLDFRFEKINIEWTWMNMDVPRVKQIFVNLLSNAAKFTPAGGRVDLIMELVSEDETMIRDKFIVRDTGIGMGTDFLPHLFEPFAQENRLVEGLGGTGLGLTIVKSIVELMGGTITVKSKPGEGTEFTLFLNFPLAQKPASAELPAQEKPAVLPKGLHILMCEDHPLNAQIAMRLLAGQKAEVTWAQNGRLGVEAFQNSAPGYFDAILMDVRMPVLDGLAAAGEIRALARPDAATVPILAMTANAYEEDVEKSLAAGMNAHLAKPIEPAQMFAAIAACIQNRKA